MDLNANTQVEEASIEAVVLRCTCGQPESHTGQACPQAQREDHGIVSYFNRNPIKQVIWEVRQSLQALARRGRA
jgi:hypothetical protein